MRIQCCSPFWLATVICMVAGLPFAAADEAPGVVRMTNYQPTQIQPTGFFSVILEPVNDECGTVGCGESDCCPVPETACDQTCEVKPGQSCTDAGCSTGCDSGGGCGCGCSGTENASLLGRLFGGPKTRCNCSSCGYCGKGSATLSNAMFGCMTPSGASGQGAPLFGKYQITYSNRPAYADTRDGKAWAAQGYGMPVTIPTAPVVRYSYNYSQGTPASRLTPLSTYNPSTSPQELFLQSW